MSIRVIAAGAGIDRASCHKMLVGKYAMSTAQAERIAQVLKHTITWTPRRGRSRPAKHGAGARA